MKEDNAITCVAKYLEKVKRIVELHPDEIIVYRGEDQLHDEPCKPNIFRKKVLNRAPFYEKNLLDSMRQHKLSPSTSYLENAIDAQHGEFPSRLLDVTYNCLVALYFAVTPYYHESEDYHDDEPGQVYVFHLNRVASPSAKATQDCYDDIINKRQPVLANNMIFNKSHIFIDHCKMNHRIVAQQGAFILFQGEDAEPIPAYMFDGIIIPAKSKEIIRKELNVMFGIHTGSIYPEIVNLASELTHKSEKIVCANYNMKTEIESIILQFEKELEYYLGLIMQNNKDNSEVERITEKVIYSYYLGILQLRDYIKTEINHENKKEMDYIEPLYEYLVSRYDKCLDEFQESLIDINYCAIDITNLKI